MRRAGPRGVGGYGGGLGMWSKGLTSTLLQKCIRHFMTDEVSMSTNERAMVRPRGTILRQDMSGPAGGRVDGGVERKEGGRHEGLEF